MEVRLRVQIHLCSGGIFSLSSMRDASVLAKNITTKKEGNVAQLPPNAGLLKIPC